MHSRTRTASAQQNALRSAMRHCVRSRFVALALLLAGTAPLRALQPERPHPILLRPDDAAWGENAPPVFDAVFETSRGTFVIEVHRDWAPLGADRFYNLVRHGYYDGVRINRVVPGFIAQWGLSPFPEVTRVWKPRAIPDDPVRQSNVRGRIAYATTGPDTRSTQVYINLVDNTRLDAQGFSPFGQVSRGMDVVDRLYGEYGEESGGGMRAGRQGPIEQEGNAWFDRNYPNLDVIVRARVVTRAP